MANNKKDVLLKKLNDADNKSSIGLTGATNELELENIKLRDAIRDTTHRSSRKYGDHTDGKNLDYFTDLGLSTLMSDAVAENRSKKDKVEAKQNPDVYFKKFMTEQDIADKSSMLLGDLGKYTEYQNYDAIYKHIPECAAALKVYRNNIISPDDFTKMIFEYNYVDTVDEQKVNRVKRNIEKLIRKYKIDLETENIVTEVLKYGDCYYAVLSVEKELNTMLNDMHLDSTTLHENIGFYDTKKTDIEITASDIILTEAQEPAIKDFFNLKESKDLKEQVANFINEHIIIGSKLELLQERAEYEYENKNNKAFDIDSEFYDKKKKNTKKQKKDESPLYLNGSILRKLEPERVIELSTDGFCYGYYYVEESDYTTQLDSSQPGDYLGSISGKNSTNNNYAMNAQGVTANVDNGNVTGMYNLNKEKTELISQVFIDTISKKINRDYIRHNKKFKDFIYNIVKQKYFREKQIKLTYFTPDEVVHFQVDPVYRDIVFFAKLYLAMLTNYMIINIGRGHDKRVIYVQAGLDDQYEQAVTNVIESIKTKEFRLSDTDINTVLQLNPGALDDYFIPVINGDRSVEIETLQGMDADITNNGFLDWLRKSMMNGMCVPANLIDVMTEVDYARQLSQQNSAFVKNITRYQTVLQPYFEKLIRRLYDNEFKYGDDGDTNETEDTNLDKIEIKFPTPHLLIGQVMQEQIQISDQNAEYIANIMVPPKQDGSAEDKRLMMKSYIFKDMMKNLPYEKYQKYLETDLELDLAKDKLKNDLNQPPVDPNANPYGY